MSVVQLRTQTKHVFTTTETLPATDESFTNKEDLLGEEASTKTEFKPDIVWFNVIGFLVLHIIVIYSFCLIHLPKIATILWTTALILMSAIGGISMGAHRLYSHNAFEANNAIHFVLIALHTLAGQNCLWIWVRDHRQHHKYSDTNADPHNSQRGFFFSHIGWLMVRKHPDVIAKGKGIDMSDLERNSYVMFQKRHYKKLYFLCSVLIPVGIPCLLWNEALWISFLGCMLVRVVISLHLVWSINSVAHKFGTKPYTDGMSPTDNEITSYILGGDGWHNFHHTFPWDYRSAEIGRYGLVTSIIEYCERHGWAYNLKIANPELVRKHAQKHGDGTHPVYGNKMRSYN